MEDKNLENDIEKKDMNTADANSYYIDNTQAFINSAPEPITMAETEKKSTMGLSIASMVIGILSMTLCCVLGSALGILGLIFGIIALAKKHEGTGMAIAGVITSIIGFLVGVFMIVYVIAVGYTVNTFSDEMYKEFSQNPDLKQYINDSNIDIDDFDSLLKELESSQF